MMNANINVDIILAAHNGAKFIQEQINSLLQQSHKALRVIVTDDGSEDGTIDVVNDIMAKDPRVSCHICHDAKGVVENFNNGLQFSDADYIMFCDQDDVWENNKVEVMLAEIVQKERRGGDIIPCLGFSNLQVVDENLTTIDEDFYRFSHLEPRNNLKLNYLLWRSSVYGCTIMMNKTLLNLAGKVPDKIAMHDHWYAFQAALNGNVFYVARSLIKYRQHSANVVGAHQRGLGARLKRFKKTLKGIQRSVESARVMNALLHHQDVNQTLSIGEKFTFLQKNVMPYNHERPAYSTLFSLLWLIHG